MLTATEYVVKLYEQFPELYFYDEREYRDCVKLYFEFKKLSEKAVEWLKSVDTTFTVMNNRLIIIAREDEFYE
ncbi:MAG: hypothetical protein J6S67_15840 [Methanobrevibacter sp.]|nr:hypothetical protein [Methanobrevibacter sp.]